MAKVSQNSVWVYKGLQDDCFTFAPDKNIIGLNDGFAQIYYRCDELLCWMKCQINKSDPSILVSLPEYEPQESPCNVGNLVFMIHGF